MGPRVRSARRRAGQLSTERSEGTSQIRGKSTDFLRELVAPVEVARASPEAIVTFDSSGLRLLVVFFAGPFEGDRRLRRDGRLCAVHRVLDAGLLLGLEQRVIVERILVLVAVERQLIVELRVLFLQLEMILDDLREKRRCVYGHSPPPGDWGRSPERGRIVAGSADESTLCRFWRTCGLYDPAGGAHGSHTDTPGGPPRARADGLGHLAPNSAEAPQNDPETGAKARPDDRQTRGQLSAP